MKSTIEITEESHDKLTAIWREAGSGEIGLQVDWYRMGREHGINEARTIIEQGATAALRQNIERMKQEGYFDVGNRSTANAG